MKRLDPSTSAAYLSPGARASACWASVAASAHRRCAKRTGLVGALRRHGSERGIGTADSLRADLVERRVEQIVAVRAGPLVTARRFRRRTAGARCFTSRPWAVLFRRHTQCPEAGRLPGALQLVERQGSRRSPRRIVYEHDARLLVDADRDDVVVALGTIFDEEHRRTACRQLATQGVDRSVDPHGRPVPLADRLDESRVGDAAGGSIDEGFELLHRGVRVAPEAEKHCRRGAAAQCFGLWKVWNVEGEIVRCGLRRRRQRSEQQREEEGRHGDGPPELPGDQPDVSPPQRRSGSRPAAR
jgi:hypothetical protein